MKKTIVTAIRDHGFENVLSWLSLLSNPIEVLSWRKFLEYTSFRRKHKGLSVALYPAGTDGNVLVINLHSILTGVKLESILIKALQAEGFSCAVLTYRTNFWPLKYFRLFGVNQFVYFDDYLHRASRQTMDSQAMSAIEELRTVDDVMNYNFKGVQIGKYALATMSREHRLAHIDPADPNMGPLLKSYLQRAIKNVEAAISMMDEIQPTKVIFLEKVYMPYGELFSVALDRKADVIQWSGCHRESALMLKRYTMETRDWDRSSISDQSWEWIKKSPFSDQQAIDLKNEMAETYKSGQWFSETGTQSMTKIISKEEFQLRLQLDPSKKTAIIFAHMFWDAVLFDEKDLFVDFEDWLIETVRVACQNRNLNWIVKLHPANRVKAVRDNYHGEYSELISLKKNIGDLPGHIKIIEPSTDISTFSLFSVMDFCLTVRGTIGIEASSFGIPVLTAGKGRYGGLGFTFDSHTKEEYLRKLRDLPCHLEMSANQIVLAQKYAYTQFVLRPFKLQTVRFSYANDKNATASFDVDARSNDELRRAPDLKVFAAWVRAREKLDYLSS